MKKPLDGDSKEENNAAGDKKQKKVEVRVKVIGEKETKRSGRGSATTWAQTIAIPDCLENPNKEVFNQITGKATSKMWLQVQKYCEKYCLSEIDLRRGITSLEMKLEGYIK